MNQEFKITESQVNKILKYVSTKPYNEVIEIINDIQSNIVPSRETELLAKINGLEADRDKKADEYKEVLGAITKEIESLKSEKE